MQAVQQINRTKTMVECGILVAMATALGLFPIFEMPMGGSVTLCSTAPLVIISFRNGKSWGMVSAFVYGMIQMILGLKNVLYCTTLVAMIGCALLDYVIAYMVVGASCLLAVGGSREIKIVIGTVISGFLRFLCSFLSGILIWGGYAPEGTPVWLYSLTYNGSFMLPEIALTAIACTVIVRITERTGNKM